MRCNGYRLVRMKFHLQSYILFLEYKIFRYEICKILSPTRIDVWYSLFILGAKRLIRTKKEEMSHDISSRLNLYLNLIL